eukprot:3468786-Prymnesium_polylepis.1
MCLYVCVCVVRVGAVGGSWGWGVAQSAAASVTAPQHGYCGPLPRLGRLQSCELSSGWWWCWWQRSTSRADIKVSRGGRPRGHRGVFVDTVRRTVARRDKGAARGVPRATLAPHRTFKCGGGGAKDVLCVGSAGAGG